MLVLRMAEFCQHSVLHIIQRSGYGRASLPGGITLLSCGELCAEPSSQHEYYVPFPRIAVESETRVLTLQP